MEAATLFFSEVASILPSQLSFSLPSLISSCETKFSYPENITITSKPPTRVISTSDSRVKIISDSLTLKICGSMWKIS